MYWASQTNRNSSSPTSHTTTVLRVFVVSSIVLLLQPHFQNEITFHLYHYYPGVNVKNYFPELFNSSSEKLGPDDIGGQGANFSNHALCILGKRPFLL